MGAIMLSNTPECEFTKASIVSWKRKLAHFDMGQYFGRRPCSIAKGVFATQAIKKVVLEEHKATIGAYFNGDTINFDITLDHVGHLETSIDKLNKLKITSQIVTIAALMAITKLVNSENIDCAEENFILPMNLPSDRTSASDTVEKVNVSPRHNFNKNVLVKFSICGNDVTMRAFLDNSEKKPIFMQSSSSITVISGNAKKMSLLRLLFYAKKAKFEFCTANRDYRSKNLRDAIDLIGNKFSIWNKYFYVQLSPEMLLLRRGSIFPNICAKVHELDPEHIEIEWIIETEYGPIDSQRMTDLLKANGRLIFIEKIGAVALTANQISVVRHVFCSDHGTKLRKYILYVLLNQHHIRVDVSGCKITHIDVGNVKFRLPEFLKNYQRNGVYAMQAILDAGCHCLLADEMGLGKTVQVLSLIWANGKNKHSLVICPASVISVWQKEIEKFFPDNVFATVDKRYNFSNKPNFLLCSYAQVHKMNTELRKLSFDYIILDEAQYAKNPRSKTMLACCNVNGRFRIAITGTPIENNLMDIWSIFKFLMPGFFCGYKQFQENINQLDFRQNFQKQIATFTIRRTKKSVAIELPKRNEIELTCKMNHAQRLAYDAIRNNLQSKLTNFNTSDSKMRLNILSAITRLRQAACSQFILPEALRYNNSRDSHKIDILMLKLETIVAEGSKVLVFSQFLEFLKEIKSRIAENIPKTKVFSLTGSTPNRKTLVDTFQNTKGSAVMLISLKAGGIGITLHAAEYAFLMEPWWNPAVEEQAIARIHRIGQKNITTIYRLITEDSIEERMRAIQASKNELFNDFIKTGVDNIAMTNFFLKNLESLLD
ncbi:MAG: DEAD/DEAH box helicase [Puniceicoccales bacterium]|jgi:superfamily II DNA or RNA helicase|nr:DEAD/DEAH box helicase [Puniceicoccales bacterium]